MSKPTLHRLLLRELARPVPPLPQLGQVRYVLFDAKFLFGRRFCLLVVFDATANRPVAGTVVRSENRACITPWLYELQAAGLHPVAVTTDGRQAGIYAFREVWPTIAVQRCLFHIRMQVDSWARQRPRYASARALKQLVAGICSIRTEAQLHAFREAYAQLRRTYESELAGLDKTHPVQGDLIRAYQLVHHALTDCFRYLEDSRIAKTTSPLEGYFKQVQRIRGFQHNGLTEEHLFQFLAWRLYYDGREKHTF